MKLNFVAPLNHMSSLSEMAIKRLNWTLRAFANPSFTNWDQMLSLAVTVLNQFLERNFLRRIVTWSTRYTRLEIL